MVNSLKILVIIQARMGSERLPQKVLMPLGKTNVLDYVVSRCKMITQVDDVIVATTIEKSDAAIEQWCVNNAVTCFRGSEEDVLERYYKCAAKHNPDYVMRVTADCPFVDYEMATNCIKLMAKERKDYVKPRKKLPRGLAVELFSFEALKKIHKTAKDKPSREHVTYYAYKNPNEFTSATLEISESLAQPQLRITLDTKEDYELCQNVALHFDNKLVSSEEVVKYLLENPQIAKINAHVKQKKC